MQHSHALLEAAWADHRVPLVRRLTALTRDPDTAEELVQEAFLRLAREVMPGGRRLTPGPGCIAFRGTSWRAGAGT